MAVSLGSWTIVIEWMSEQEDPEGIQAEGQVRGSSGWREVGGSPGASEGRRRGGHMDSSLRDPVGWWSRVED